MQPAPRSRPRFKILILHDNQDLTQVRRTSFNHSFCLLKYAPWNDYTLQSVRDPVPAWVRSRQFDLIVIDTTFLCWRWTYPREENFGRVLRDFAFVAESDALKVALPQDEYDHAALLDQWMVDWRVDRIDSVCFAHRDVLYPQAAATAEIVEGLTGYIDDADIAMMSRAARPFEQREIDVGYRAKNLPPYFGRFGRLKAEIGERFRTVYANSGLRLDVSVSGRDTFVGDAWLQFLGNCRYTLGCESGSSLLDAEGDINRACAAYLAQHPRAGFDEVEAACFPGQDMVRVYSAISPRIFEAALAETCQILVPGPYMGVLKPDEHYIPLEQDTADQPVLEEALGDWRRAKERIAACRATLLSAERLTYRGFVRNLLDWTEQKRAARDLPIGRRIAAIEPPATHAAAMHAAAEAAVRAAVAREDEEPEEDTGTGDGEGANPFAPKICLLAMSQIVDDPRVRRQGELFYGRGWGVSAVGIPGGRSALPPWRILSKAAASAATLRRLPQAVPAPAPVINLTPVAATPVMDVAAHIDAGPASAEPASPEPASPAPESERAPPVYVPPPPIQVPREGLHQRFKRWRHGVSSRLAEHPKLWQLAFRLWSLIRSATLLTLRTVAALRRAVGRLREVPRLFRRIVRAIADRLGVLETLKAVIRSRAVSAVLRASKLWQSLLRAMRVQLLGVRPQLAERIFWYDLPISHLLRAMYDAASKTEADIWLANDWTALPIAARLAREKGGIYVYDTHEFGTEEFAHQPHWRRWQRPVVCAIEGKYIRGAMYVSTVSAGIGKRLDELYRLSRPAMVIRNTPTYQTYGFRPTGERIRVLYHGIVVPGRGLELAIDSVPLWDDRFDLTIRGPENPAFTPQLREQVAKLGLEHRVTIAPPVAMTALVREAAAFDIGFFALPGHSRQNELALPNKIFEYIMAGLCLCTSDLPEIAAIIADHDLGVTVHELDPQTIAGAINAFDRERIDACKRNALVAAKQLCWEHESARLVADYAAAIGKPATSVAEPILENAAE